MFITFEGMEGCGKSTQARSLALGLERCSVPHVLTIEPGGTRIGGVIRSILLDGRNHDLSALAELLLYTADRAQHVKEVIEPALDQGKWVVCDRFFDATTVYQGHARGQDMALIRALNNKVTHGVSPDITFLLDCPVDIGLERALRREARRDIPRVGTQDRFEKEEREFHQAVREGYLSIAGEEQDRFVVLDSRLKEHELEKLIFKHISPFLPVNSA